MVLLAGVHTLLDLSAWEASSIPTPAQYRACSFSVFTFLPSPRSSRICISYFCRVLYLSFSWSCVTHVCAACTHVMYTCAGVCQDGILDMCAQRGIGVVMGAPYSSGILATGAIEGAMYAYEPATEETLDKVCIPTSRIFMIAVIMNGIFWRELGDPYRWP